MDTPAEALIRNLIHNGEAEFTGDACIGYLYADLCTNATVEQSREYMRREGLESDEETERIIAAEWVIGSLNSDGFVDYEIYESREAFETAWKRCEDATADYGYGEY